MNSIHGEVVRDKRIVYRTPPKMAFVMGMLSGVTAASLIATTFAFAQLAAYNNNDADATAAVGTGVVAGVDDTQPSVEEPETAPIADIVIRDTDHVLGSASAPVTVVVYSDFECSYCARHAPTIEQIFEAYDEQVRVVFRHFPLSFHANAQKAAEASECAGAQGKFWEMHDELFALSEASALNTDTITSAAARIGIDQGAFSECFDGGVYAQYVQDQFAEGVQLGVQGTPATFVNGQLISGAVPYSSLASLIDSVR